MKPDHLSRSRLFGAVERLVDPHVGIIRGVEELQREPGAPAFFYFYAQACDTSTLSGRRNFRDGGGASVDRSGAMAKAIGEAVERYCSAIYDREELPLTSFDAAPFACVSPNEFALYDHGQYARPQFCFVPFSDRTPIRWTPAVELMTGETWYVPAVMVFMPYVPDREHGEVPIVQNISTGLACHTSFSEAAISGICEVIERDAFMITWQARLARPQIRIETLSDHNRDLVTRFERIGSSVTLFNLIMDHGVPTILAVLRGHNREQPALVFAASTNLDAEQAVRKSLEEVAHTRRLSQYLKASRPRLVPACDYGNIVDQDDHLHLYSQHESAPLADFVFESRERMHFGEILSLATGDPGRDLELLARKVHAMNHRVLLADLTTPDVGELGLSVVRAVIPGFHPLFMGYAVRALGASRLWELPQKLGYKGVARASGDNPAPHPYP